MTKTKGNVIVENIKIGDIHYEFEYGIGIKTEVISIPEYEIQDDGDDGFTWIVVNDEEKGRVDISAIDSPLTIKPVHTVQNDWIEHT